jgi:DNA replication protein DnaC
MDKKINAYSLKPDSAWKKSNVRTFVTTNLPPEFGKDSLLSAVLDDREVDRMVEMFTSIEWHGSSLRKN